MLNLNSLMFLTSIVFNLAMKNNVNDMILLVSHKISEPKYIDVDLLRTLHLWDDLTMLFGVFGWQNYVKL